MSLPEEETLESKCLDVIICNFDQFCAAFNSNENYKFYLEFIQRRWSTQILQKLFQRCLLKNEHLQIVLNKYVTELDFQAVLNCDGEIIISRLKEIGDVIQKVSLKDIAVFFNFDSIWSYLPNVHTIELQCTNCSNQSLFVISNNCPHLKNLNLFGCSKVNDKGLTFLVQSKLSLESLNVDGTGVTYKGVAYILSEIPSLKKLWHSNVPKAIFEVLGLNDPSREVAKDKVFNLNNIVISNNAFRPENHLISLLEICQSVCPYINDLTVSEIVTEKQLALCSSFPELRTVNLQCTLSSNYGLGINNFLKIRGDKIRTMSLMSFSLSLEVLLNNCPNLECLTLEYPCFEDTPLSSSNMRFSNLRKLYLYNDFVIADENAPFVASLISLCPDLEELNMRRCDLSTVVTDTILSHPKSLKILNLSNTTVTASFLEDVLRLHKNLKVLRIDNSGITPHEYDDLMDIVDTMENKVHILWADYTEAIKQLYNTDLNALFRVMKRQVMKL